MGTGGGDCRPRGQSAAPDCARLRQILPLGFRSGLCLLLRADGLRTGKMTVLGPAIYADTLLPSMPCLWGTSSLL